ncbi:MAG: NAD(P)-dependent oxidoreductase [Betaproteobacteria bacterium]|nr:NAD(P)-dependent oxidoreductase [Betaproteobacteria bacterium]
MNITVTGATGFVGRHVVAALLARGHDVTCVARTPPPATELPWRDCKAFVSCDVHDDTIDAVARLGVPEVLVHLAWPGLPNYRDLFHFERNLPAAYRFIKRMVEAGTPQVLITGTCFEYGMQSGPLAEDAPARPDNPYGLAKNTLRLFLQALQSRQPFSLQWARLFYLYGTGQNANSVLAQLDRAIDAGERSFNMSRGEQLRDYLPVQEAARSLAALTGQREFNGIVNCCSGQPISIRSLVERRIKQRSADIALNLGHFPYRDYEPFAFWGSRYRLDQLVGKRSQYDPTDYLPK